MNRILLLLLLFLVSCAEVNVPMLSCSVEQLEDGVSITCPDGTNAIVKNGVDGLHGQDDVDESEDDEDDDDGHKKKNKNKESD
jgi:hypothetical protein